MYISKKQLEVITGKKLKFENKANNLILATTFSDTTLGDQVQSQEGSQFEWFQIFDQHDHPIIIEGKELIFYRKECHGKNRIPNVYHRGTDAWVINNKNEILVPTRSPKKDLYPSMRDASVGEHNNIGESYLSAAVRGCEEELKVQIKEQDLQLICKLPVYDENQWQWSQYFLYRDLEGLEYKHSLNEISQIEWIPIEELQQIEKLKKLNFRPDHLPALSFFLDKYLDKYI